MRPHRAVLLYLLAAAALFASACSDAPSKEQCKQLLDHLIDLEMKAGGTDGALTDEMKADLDKQRKQVIEFSESQNFIKTCTEKTPRRVVECGLAAKTPEDVAKCDGAK